MIVLAQLFSQLLPVTLDSKKKASFFFFQSNLTQHVSLNITDDDVSNEPDQEYGLTLSQAPQDVALSPHSNTTIIIQDNDCMT